MQEHTQTIWDTARIRVVKNLFEDHWEDLMVSNVQSRLLGCVKDAIEELFGMEFTTWLEVQRLKEITEENDTDAGADL